VLETADIEKHSKSFWVEKGTTKSMPLEEVALC
jgi:hypothetical protein